MDDGEAIAVALWGGRCILWRNEPCTGGHRLEGEARTNVGRIVSIIAALTLMAVSGAATVAQPAEPVAGCTYFTETGHNLCVPFEDYWSNNGGLPVFGFPINEATFEFNADRQDTYLTQYFERERMEHHPALEGSRYEILLGRLGNDVLLLMGRNWMDFSKADPSAPHYFAETGHAIGAEFWDYWSSHGLDFGDEGVSFAESLALFGFPISEPAIETNSSGHTVLTQWFERARFEHHPDNSPGSQILLGHLGSEFLNLRDGGGMPPPSVGDVIADGLNSPRGIDVGDDGTVYVAEAGIGGDTCISVLAGAEGPSELCFGTSGQVTQISPAGLQTVALGSLTSLDIGGGEAVGPQDVVAGDDLYVIMGLGGDPADRTAIGEPAGDLGWLIAGPAGGETRRVVDVAGWEGIANPDGGDAADGGIDSNPYSIVMASDGDWIASDAGGNDLLHVDSEGVISTLAVFSDRLVEAPPFMGLPAGAQVPMESVPTGAVEGSDGAIYVGELTGFPFVPGAARVWRVTQDGEASVYASGFTNVIDVAFDGAGNLFVLEMVAGGLLNATEDDPASAASRIVKVMPDGTRMTVVDSGLVFATGLAIGPDGTGYVSNFGVMPGMGQVVAIEGLGESQPEGPAFTVVIDELDNPRGLFVTDDGDLFVTQAGTGGDECQDAEVDEGTDPVEICFGATGSVLLVDEEGAFMAVSSIVSMLDIRGDIVGVQDVAIGEDGLIYSIVGLGADPADRQGFPAQAADLGWIVSASTGSNPIPDIDVAFYETVNNPDNGALDSNPYSFASDGAGGWVVSDAGMNALLHVNDLGQVSTMAVFGERLVEAPPFLGMPAGSLIPMQAVPTGVVQGPDGAYYVGELTGFPFEVGSARVWRVTATGQASIYAEGFTNIVDLAFDSQGNLYVLELATNSLLSEDVSSAVIRVSSNGLQTEVAGDGLTFATGIAIGPEDTVYVSNFGVMPGMGEVVSFVLE